MSETTAAKGQWGKVTFLNGGIARCECGEHLLEDERHWHPAAVSETTAAKLAEAIDAALRECDQHGSPTSESWARIRRAGDDLAALLRSRDEEAAQVREEAGRVLLALDRQRDAAVQEAGKLREALTEWANAYGDIAVAASVGDVTDGDQTRLLAAEEKLLGFAADQDER